MNAASNLIIQSAHQILADVTAGRLTPTVYRNLETRPRATAKTMLQWWQAGNTGNDGGANAKPHGTYDWPITIPELITISPAAAFDNFLYVMTFPLPAELPSNFVLSFDDFSVTPDSGSKTQALECQVELRDGLHVYNMAWQRDQATKSMRIFDHIKGDWFAPATSVPIPYPGIATPLSFIAEFRIDRQAHTTTHQQVWLNGSVFEVATTQAATPQTDPLVELSVAFQVDPNSAAAVIAAISNMSVAWLP